MIRTTFGLIALVSLTGCSPLLDLALPEEDETSSNENTSSPKQGSQDEENTSSDDDYGTTSGSGPRTGSRGGSRSGGSRGGTWSRSGGGSTGNPDSIFSASRDRGFRYDSETGNCKNDRGEPGLNRGYFGECGEIQNLHQSSLQVSGKNLRGLQVDNSHIGHSDFTGADLTGAYFNRTELGFSRFDRAILYRTYFKLHPDNFALSSRAFEGAKINARTLNSVYSYQQMVDMGADLDGINQAGTWETYLSRDGFEIEWDPSLSAVDQAIAGSDFDRLDDLHLEVPAGGHFEKIFGGRDAYAVRNFVKKRIRYFLADSKKDGSKTRAASNGSAGVWIDDLNKPLFYAIDALNSIIDYANGKIPLPQLPKSEEKIPYLLGQPVQVDDYRVGNVIIGPRYLSPQETQMSRLNTLVHEARHSDCVPDRKHGTSPEDVSDALHYHEKDRREVKNKITRLLNRAETIVHDYDKNNSSKDSLGKMAQDSVKLANEAIDQYKKYMNDYFYSAPVTKQNRRHECGFKHVTCEGPQFGEGIAGSDACERGVRFGAYAVGAVFNQAVYQYCKNCSDLQKARSKAEAINARKRVLDWSALENGSLGEPITESY